MCKHKRAWLQILPSFAVLEPKAISRRLSDPLITQHALSLRSDCWTILRTSNREVRYPRCGLIPFNSFFFLSAVYVYIVQAPSLLSIYLCLCSLWVSISGSLSIESLSLFVLSLSLYLCPSHTHSVHVSVHVRVYFAPPNFNLSIVGVSLVDKCTSFLSISRHSSQALGLHCVKFVHFNKTKQQNGLPQKEKCVALTLSSPRFHGHNYTSRDYVFCVFSRWYQVWYSMSSVLSTTDQAMGQVPLIPTVKS